MCSCSLIHSSVLSSLILLSSCFYSYQYLGNPGTIYVGSIERQQGQAYAVSYSRIHPLYNGNRDNPDWDAMILKLVQEVPATVATPVMLNSNSNFPIQAGDSLIAVGFGRLKEGGKSDSDSLQAVTIPYVPNAICRDSYAQGRISETTVCAGQTGADACQGDSGGPLFAANRPNLQVGIVSWGYGCARPEFPGVYTRISTMFPWIQAQTCLQADNPPSDFCVNASVPIDMSLTVDMVLNPAIYRNYSWGLYHVESRSTLYQSVEDNGIVTEWFNTATSMGPASIIRQGKEDKKEEQPAIQPNAIRLQWDNVLPGNYYFTMKNPMGTGLTSATDKVWIRQGSRRRLVTVPHNFGSVYTRYFTVSDHQLVAEIRQQQQTVDPPPVTVEMMVDVFYDANPEETAWELRNLNTNEVVAFISVGSIAESKYESYTYNVQRGHRYQIKIWDNAGNGLTNGWMSVWVGHVMVWKSDQDSSTSLFTFEATKVIVI